MTVSNFALMILARTGALPAEDTAIITGDRSTIDGIMKLDNSGESTTFTGILAFFADLEINALTDESSVEAIMIA